jgi:hypothetical protein
MVVIDGALFVPLNIDQGGENSRSWGRNWARDRLKSHLMLSYFSLNALNPKAHSIDFAKS